MAPLVDDNLPDVPGSAINGTSRKPRFAIIGAGSRGNAYAAAINRSGLGIVAAVVEPITFKRRQLGSKYVWFKNEPRPGQEFEDWNDFIAFEKQQRRNAPDGAAAASGIDGVFVCVRDELHCKVVTALAPLGLHIMCEKPLATTLTDCLTIRTILNNHPQRIFAIGHVLRYSPHNMLLRHLLLKQRVIGDVLSMEHTEPVGWWHFSHSYVRGQWRKESISAPSLLTKSCHDIDFILWMLCSGEDSAPHSDRLPGNVSSAGTLKQFKRSRKPKEAGNATNCMSCPIKDTCLYSAKRIYHDRHLAQGKAHWPVDIVNPEIPEILSSEGPEAAKEALMSTLSEDYDAKNTAVQDIEARPWYGRCVWESDNDVCDDQVVTIEWEDVPGTEKGAKTATFHMIAQTLAQCERRGRIYGMQGEISYDSKSITVHDFTNGETKKHNPEVPKNSHHGGGDDGLTQMFVQAVAAVKRCEMGVQEAQKKFLGCTLDEVIISHAFVFAAEEARRKKEVVDWNDWWEKNGP